MCGASEEAVTAALDLLASELAQAIDSPAVGYSHFLSLPLASHRPLVARLSDLRSSLLQSVGFPCTHEHLTAPADAAAGSTAGVDGAAGDAATADGGDNASGDADGWATIREGEGEGDVEGEGVKDDCAAAVGAREGIEDCGEEAVEGEGRADARQERESGEEKSWEQQPGGQRGKGVKDKYGGVHPSIFINPATFHLTVQMLKLWSPLRVQAAADALQAAMPRVQEVLGDAPLVIRLLGLKCMRGHPSKAHVLYADMQEVDGGNRLRAVCEVLRAACREAGLVTPRDCHQPLKLHATIMNTSHRKG
ncbi:unnamed protein product, partial [Closterium sp. NIES-64]